MVAGYALLIFSFLAYLYIAEPLAHIEKFGITAAFGLFRPAHLRHSLWVVVLFNGSVMAVRLMGIVVDA